MSRLPGAIGPSNRTRSINVDPELAINYLIELPGAGSPMAPASYYGRPGLHPWQAMGAGPHRAAFAQDNLAFVVSGGGFYEVFAGGTSTFRGTVVVDGNPATICSNGGADGSGGHQLFITAGGHGYIHDLVSQSFVEIVASGFPRPCLMGAFLNGYFEGLKTNADKIQISNLLDGTLWDDIDVLQVLQQPGNIASLITSHQELWPFSATKVNPWVGTSDTSIFTPLQGATIDHGIYAPFSAQRLDNTLFWISQTEQGGAIVVRADGYSPKIISPPAINTFLQHTPNVNAAVAFSLQIDGHALYLNYLPNTPYTPVYDLSNDTWVYWATWNPNTTRFEPFNGRTHMWAFGKHLIGAIDSGWLYELSFDYTQDTLKGGA